MDDLVNRRAFLRVAAAAGVAWAATDLGQVEEALAWAGQHAGSGAESLDVLTNAQADVLDALTSRILPSVGGKPGAHEAGVIYFIDRALSTFNAGQKALYVDGLADLDGRVKRKWTETATFAALPSAQQDEVLHDIETTPFFQAVRFDTIIGAFALPTWGGNRDLAGWQILGFAHMPHFEAPFGYYDAEINRGR
jgi:gluconate 2-dehydrogenase gamma chain